MDGVEVTVRLDPPHEGLARQGSKFWVETPRLGLHGVANLENIVRGNYLTILPGDGPVDDTFEGLVKPPITETRDLHVTLSSTSLGGLQVGGPVMMRQVVVGQIVNYELSADGQFVSIGILIHQPFISLVGHETSFWRIPAVRMEANLSGIDLQMESMAALLAGGIGIDNPRSGPGKSVAPGHDFVLYESEEERDKSQQRYAEFFLAARQLGSLGAGKPVYYRGIEVGKVLDANLSNTATRVMIRIGIEERYVSLVHSGSKFWNVSGIGVDFSLFSGTKIQTQSVEAILFGGVGFATPETEDAEDPVPQGYIFELYDKPEEKWLEWQPELSVAN